MNKFSTPIAIIIGAVLIAAGLYFGLSHQGAASGALQGAAPSVDIKDVKTDGDPYIGKADAPVVMAFWSDFQCPFCKAVETGGVEGINFNVSAGRTPLVEAVPDIIKLYVDTGKLRIVFKDYPFLGEDSLAAGEYGRSVWKLYPDQYFAWRTEMYKAQDEEGDQGFGDAASIDELIKTKLPKIDGAKVKADVALNKDAYDALLAANTSEGASFGIQGTPGFIVGKTLIPGAAELSTFTAAIDPLLK